MNKTLLVVCIFSTVSIYAPIPPVYDDVRYVEEPQRQQERQLTFEEMFPEWNRLTVDQQVALIRNEVESQSLTRRLRETDERNHSFQRMFSGWSRLSARQRIELMRSVCENNQANRDLISILQSDLRGREMSPELAALGINQRTICMIYGFTIIRDDLISAAVVLLIFATAMAMQKAFESFVIR